MTNPLDQAVQERELATLLRSLDQRLANLERAAQLPYSAARGQLRVVDDTGTVISTIGRQADGTVGVTVASSPPPPTPVAPLVEASTAALTVAWDGQWVDAYNSPLNLSHLEVHAGAASDFQPGKQTMVATLAASGASTTLATSTYTPLWIRLVAVNAAGDRGPASAAAHGTPLKVVSDDLVSGIIGELQLANSAVTATKIAVNAVGSDAIAAAAVIAGKIAANAVTAGALAADTVTGREIKALSITGDKIAANTITAGQIAAGSITAAKLAADAIDGKTITGVTLVGSTIQTALTGRRVLLSPVDPTDGSDSPSALFFSGAKAEQKPGRLTAEVRTTSDGSTPMTRMTAPQLNADGSHTPTLWLMSGGPATVDGKPTGFPSTGGYSLYVNGDGKLGGEAVIRGAAGTDTVEASIQQSVRRNVAGGYKTALTYLGPSGWFVQLADQIANLYLNSDGLNVKALLGEVLVQTKSGLRLQGGDITLDGASSFIKKPAFWGGAWKVPTWQNGCGQLGSWQNVGVKVRPDGMVAMRGIASIPPGFTGGVICTIDDPALRPRIGEVFAAVTPNNVNANVFVQPNGNVEVWNATGAFGGWLSFGSIEWSIID